MLVIEVTFLTGRFVATSATDRSRWEWPPHPARLFSALVATWADQEPPSDAERAVLEILEGAGAPAIWASDADPRSAVTHYVPVNDAAVVGLAEHDKRAAKLAVAELELATIPPAAAPADERRRKKAAAARAEALDVTKVTANVGATPVASALTLLPSGRNRQARVFPSVTPRVPVVAFVWADLQLSVEDAQVLDDLLARVVRVGHSSSFVSCRTAAEPPATVSLALSPDAASTGPILRCTAAGQLRALERAHAHHQGSRPRTLPSVGVAYRRGAARADESMDTRSRWTWIAFEFEDRTLPATRAAELAEVIHRAVLRHVPDPVPEAVSGHQPGGRPTANRHLAVGLLPFVGHRHASGLLLGAALLMPAGEDRRIDADRALARGLLAWEEEQPGGLELRMGTRGLLRMYRVVGESALAGLRARSWSGPSRVWASATPVALPRHPGRLRAPDPTERRRAWEQAEEGILASCRHVGLPEPANIRCDLAPPVAGALPANRYPRFVQRVRGSEVARALVHVRLRFAEPLDGPLLIGAGRYRGLGLLRPLPEEEP